MTGDKHRLLRTQKRGFSLGRKAEKASQRKEVFSMTQSSEDAERKSTWEDLEALYTLVLSRTHRASCTAEPGTTMQEQPEKRQNDGWV